MIGERLKELRLKAGLTQTELSEYVNVSQGAIGNWEANNRDPDYATLTRLADYFHVTTDYLLGRDIKTAPAKAGASAGKSGEGQKEKAADTDELSEDERTILELLRQVPDEDLPATHRAIKALLAGMRDGE